MQSDQPPLPPVSLPSRRRLMMQQLERHADQISDHDHIQEAAHESVVNKKNHSLQQEAADDYDHEVKLKNGSTLHAKYGLSIQNDISPYEDDDDDVDDDSQAGATDYIDNKIHIGQHESAALGHYQKRGSANQSALRVKYGLPNHTSLAANYNEDHYDECGARHPDDGHLLQREVNPRLVPLAYIQGAGRLQYRAKNSHHQDNHTGPRITPSTIEAAQAQAAELRALHSAMLNNYGFVKRDGAAYNIGHPFNQKQDSEDAILCKSRPKKAISKRKSKGYIHKDHQMQEEMDINPPSSSSSVSSTADCFIRAAHEYPIFMPAHEDMLRSTVDGLSSMNRRSSVDSSDVLLREERLNYIFDHDNKSNFSGRQYDGHSVRENNVSCLHESLNLPRRSASSLLHMHHKDNGHLLHHMSLNLPQGSQHHLFNAAKYKQNPLYDHFDNSNAEQERAATLTSSDTSSIQARHNDDNLHAADLRNKSMKAQADPYELEAGLSITGRQRALLEFLSEEPARIKAFNELATKETPDQSDQKLLQMQRIHQHDAAVLAECNLSSSRRIKGKYESPHSVNHLQGSSDHRLNHPKIHDPSISRVRQKLAAHTFSNIDHHDQNTNIAPGVSCDKCRPLVGAHSAVSPLPDSRAIDTIGHPAANPTNSSAASKEKPDQKKPASIKGWFFRGKKKQNADVSGIQATAASTVAASKVHSNTMTHGASSAPNDAQSTPSTAAATSQVFSSLINTEAERELEMAMAMDLMELKVLQAKTKRDAAMAEVLELRLAMDSMAKKLVEVERQCADLKAQLKDVQAMQRQNHKNYTTAAAGIIKASDHVAADTLDDVGSAEASVTDNCDSDSNDLREERRPAKGISVIRAGLSLGCMQPSKAEFLNAVAEARVGVKQVGRALLQHIQESRGERAFSQAQPDHKNGEMGIAVENQLVGGAVVGMTSDQAGLVTEKGMDRDNWGPIMMMCREAARREKTGMNGTSYVSSSRGRALGYYVEALISMVFHEHFENVGFDKNGTHKILDPSQRALAFYHSFLKLAKLTPTQLLTHSSPLYNSAFDRFCSRKMRCLARAVGCPARLWPDELATTFLAAARALWLLHHLAYAYQSRPPGIFRVAAPSTFDSRFMEALPTDHCHVPPSHCLVSVLVMPGFFLPDDIIKCKVLAT